VKVVAGMLCPVELAMLLALIHELHAEGDFVTSQLQKIYFWIVLALSLPWPKGTGEFQERAFPLAKATQGMASNLPREARDAATSLFTSLHHFMATIFRKLPQIDLNSRSILRAIWAC